MIDRVARALWPWMRYGIPDADKLLTWDQVNKGSLAHKVTMDAARAAIAATREPLKETRAEIDAILRGKHDGWDQALANARDKIDAALSEGNP